MTVKDFPIEWSSGEPLLRGTLHLPDGEPSEALLLTHGAGANCESPLPVALATAFSNAGIAALRFNLPFRQLRPYGPPQRGSAERDQLGIRRAVEAVKQQLAGRVYLGGHSYGGRQSSIAAAADPNLADGLLLLSYPLHPPKQPAKLRTEHFPNLQIPVLFISGSRDEFATVEELSNAISLISSRTELMTIEGAGHSLLSKKNSTQLPAQIVDRFHQFESI
ncbi:MAG TPA: alpha/beta family hydrolase [Terriglobales bacterium]|nr:alpha/beta family hydrolase [Terriglobales bacterium]